MTTCHIHVFNLLPYLTLKTIGLINFLPYLSENLDKSAVLPFNTGRLIWI